MQWLRLYHDVTANQSLGLVAHSAGVPKHCVLAAWIYLLEFASKNEIRGSVKELNAELAAFSLEMEISLFQKILETLEEKGLLHGGMVANWKKRQPEREDFTASARKRRQRSKGKLAVTMCPADVPQRHANVTLGHAPDTDKEEDKEENKKTEKQEKEIDSDSFFEEFWNQYPKKVGKKEAQKRFSQIMKKREVAQAEIMNGLAAYCQCEKVRSGYVLDPTSWLNQGRWADDYASEAELAQKRSTGSVGQQDDIIEQMRSRYEA